VVQSRETHKELCVYNPFNLKVQLMLELDVESGNRRLQILSDCKLQVLI
jgi:hypothetical protein